MKVRRYKLFRRYMRFYKMSFHFQEPFRVLVDGTFVQAALENKIHIKEQLVKMIQAKARPVITKCITDELRSLGDAFTGAAIICKGFNREKCGHANSVGAADCILSMIGEKNEQKFCVASQDESLRKRLRMIPGIPLLYLQRNIPLIEAPSHITQSEHKMLETIKTLPSAKERQKLAGVTNTDLPANVHRSNGSNGSSEASGTTIPPAAEPVVNDDSTTETALPVTTAAPTVIKPKRRRPAAPNPLSVKKRKTIISQTVSTSVDNVASTPHSEVEEKKKRKRRRQKKKDSEPTE
eukprot:GILJ01007216.1.p1 GENE.GILJ01007216.1~~GILJ01007216.1.p1  ORF type:complete len:294 (-),score=50.98 GILJ01007216.1:277-1158(-)